MTAGRKHRRHQNRISTKPPGSRNRGLVMGGGRHQPAWLHLFHTGDPRRLRLRNMHTARATAHRKCYIVGNEKHNTPRPANRPELHRQLLPLTGLTMTKDHAAASRKRTNRRHPVHTQLVIRHEQKARHLARAPARIELARVTCKLAPPF